VTTTTGKQNAPKKNVSRPPEQNDVKNLENKSRRTVIRKFAVGTAALAGCSLLPDKWTIPLVEFGVLPAHATTSGTTERALAAPPPAASVAAAGSGHFCLNFVQIVQPCASCGIWFDSATLVIVYDGGEFRHSQSGSLLIKQASGKVGHFEANISSIPAGASIQNATLYMLLNPHEGIASIDNNSVINVNDCSGAFVRTINARHDIKKAGYSKSNPNVPIDFTAYAIQIRG